MARAVSELGVGLAGLSLGLVLFLVSGGIEYGIPRCGACEVWGFPYYWRITATGTGPNSVPFEPQYQVDLVFWLVLAFVSVEVVARLISRYISRRKTITALKNA